MMHKLTGAPIGLSLALWQKKIVFASSRRNAEEILLSELSEYYVIINA